MKRIRKNDQVQIISGDLKGKTAKVLEVGVAKVMLEGITKKKHMKAQQEKAGGIVDIPRWIAISNVMLIDPEKKTPSRIKVVVKNEKKQRELVKTGRIL